MGSEEELVTYLRRTMRQPGKSIVLKVAYDSFSFIRSDKNLLQVLQGGARDVAHRSRGDALVMGNGDLFVFLEGGSLAQAGECADRISAAALDGRNLADGEENSLVTIYQLPAEYTALRACADGYLEKAQGGAPTGTASQVTKALDSIGKPAGPLNTSAATQFDKILSNIDISPYVRTQTIFEARSTGGWASVCDEYYTDLTSLRRDKFPKVTLRSAERLFLELCRRLDRLMLQQIILRNPNLNARSISINLLIETVHSPEFAEFIEQIPKVNRPRVMIELNYADLFQDVAAGRAALAKLQKEHFMAALDGLSLDLLPLLNLEKLAPDAVKLQFFKEHIELLRNPDSEVSVRKLDTSHVVLCRCDTPVALQMGRTLGISRYQGWLIDGYARERANVLQAAGD